MSAAGDGPDFSVIFRRTDGHGYSRTHRRESNRGKPLDVVATFCDILSTSSKMRSKKAGLSRSSPRPAAI